MRVDNFFAPRANIFRIGSRAVPFFPIIAYKIEFYPSDSQTFSFRPPPFAASISDIPRKMNQIISAIIDNNVVAVMTLLQVDAGLATRLIRTEKLCNSRIFHWIYVGDTVLHLAAAGYRVEIVRLLLASGADPNAAQNRRRSTPLHYAADGFINGPAWDAHHQVETIRCLLNQGAGIHLQDLNGATPLHRAVRTRCAAAVNCLLDAGANPAIRNKPGSTAFHLAAQNTGRGGSGSEKARTAQREILQAFLDRDVSPALTDAKGQSVLDWAKSDWIHHMLARHIH